jgi:mannose-6-phosphate isomerase-like protein (cupin superfamily)
MNVSNIYRAKDQFEVLQTTDLSQTAVMMLKSGQATGENPESHKNAEQILLLVIGTLVAEVGTESRNLDPGDVLVIPPNIKHKFTNRGLGPAVTFSVYSPPTYSPNEKD